MNIVDIIRKKRDGSSLSTEEITYLIKAISSGTVPDYQVSAWAMAVYFQGMDARETSDLALSMAYSGEVMDLSLIPGIKVDKHSTGGVGDKTTMVVLPLAAAAGVPVAKMSGRGLGHTGGTIDKFESIPGFQVEMKYDQFIEQVNNVGAAVVAQTGNLVPADKKLYAIRDVTATVDSIPLIASSVMSKKIAAGADRIVLDVKVGRGAFMPDYDHAAELARTMVDIGKQAGRQVVAVLSNMDQPLGRTVGNALEVKEAIETLKGRGPDDLVEICLVLAAYMVWLGGRCTCYEEAYQLVTNLLASGQGWQKFLQLVAAQNGSVSTAEGYGLPQAPIVREVTARHSGYVASIDALEVGLIAMRLGAGRAEMSDVIDYSVGVELCKKVGEYVKDGDKLAVVHSRTVEAADAAAEHLIRTYVLDAAPTSAPQLILDILQ